MKIFLDILGYILPFVAAWALVKAFNKITDKIFAEDHLNVKGNLAVVVFRSLITAVIWAAAAFTCMNHIPGFDKTWTTILTSASVAGVVLGLAAQDTLGNVFSGISMSMGKSKPFSIGDRVQIGDADPGYVKGFTLRHVELVTYYKEHIFIPNSVVAQSRIVNYSRATHFSHALEISVAYESDIDKAMDIMRDVIKSHELYAGDGDVPVTCKEAADSGVILRAIITTEKFESNVGMCSDCLLEIMKRFSSEGIEIPYNKLVILKNSSDNNT